MLLVLAFTSGFALMAYELVAARILAPSIGSSTYIWTSVIGLIIAALSIGYWLGGKIADARGRAIDVALLLLLASVGITWTLLFYAGVLSWVVEVLSDPRWQAVMASLILFVPASIVLGMLSPYLVKLNITSLKTSGQSVASLSAVNSIGGIGGTFLTGFVLFGVIGSRETLVVLIGLLLISSWLIVPRVRVGLRALLTIGVVVASLVTMAVPGGAIEIDTPTARYNIIEGVVEGEPVRGLITGPTGVQSAVYLDRPDLVFWYTGEAARITEARQPDSILVLGGGAFTLPQYLAERLPDTTIDVVEIDPELEAISSQYFGYTHPANVTLYFEDARTYVNQTDKQYDVVIVDVYSDTGIPFQLMTREYGRAVARSVAEDGIVIANIIAGFEDGCWELFEAINGSYVADFPYARVSSEERLRLQPRKNHIVTYSRSPLSIDGTTPLSLEAARSYSDNFVPTERLHQACANTA